MNSGLVAHYPFNGSENDVGGNGNNPVVVNSILTQGAAGAANRAYLFNGISNYTEVPRSASLAPAGPMTMYAYVPVDGFHYGARHGNVAMHNGEGTSDVGQAKMLTGNVSLLK